MTTSLVIAAPPLLMLVALLWSLDRQAGRSGGLLLLAVLWGGVVATSLVTATGALWLEQPAWYPYLVAPVVEELSKALLFAILIALRLVPSVPAGLAYGLAAGLGFALWENAAYFQVAGDGGLELWFYVTRTTGAALLHAVSTAVVGAAAGAGSISGRWPWRVVALVVALAAAVAVHSGWNYVCLVLSDTSAVRRMLPLVGALLLLSFLIWAVLRERWELRRELLELWQEGVIDEAVAKAMLRPWPTAALKRTEVAQPARLARALWSLALARRQLAALSGRSDRARQRAGRLVEQWEAAVRALSGSELGATQLRGPSWKRPLAITAGLGATALALHLLGEVSPVPAALARRTVVVTSGAVVRPEPLITLMGRDSYVLWQRGPSKQHREQMLTWIGSTGRQHDRSLGPLPPEEPDWFEMGAAGEGVAVATRHGDELWVRAYVEDEQRGELRFDAPEEGPEPCWPWLSSDHGRTLVGWNRLRRVAWLGTDPLELAGEPFALPDPLAGHDTPAQACSRGLLLTDETIYTVVRPTERARMAAIDLGEMAPTTLGLCPDEPELRIHSLDKDRGTVLVLLGGEGREGYRLLLARLDRSGHVLETCRHLRSMPAGEPAVVGLAGAGDAAFLAWSTRSHIFLSRVPLTADGGGERRWVLDEAPRHGPGVVRVGVVEDWLFVAWEGPSRGGRWSLKLLQTEVADLP